MAEIILSRCESHASYNVSQGHHEAITRSPCRLLYHIIQMTSLMTLTSSTDISMIIPGLYISNLETANNIKLLDALKITKIITLAYPFSKRQAYPKKYMILQIPVYDLPGAPIESYFDITEKFIKTSLRRNHRVLVHCHMGMSRSSTIVANFLMKFMDWTPSMTIAFIKKRRPIVDPNRGFRRKLNIEYDRWKRSKS